MSYEIHPNAIQLGACKIWYWDTNGWAAVGATSGGTTLTYSPKFFDLTVDQLGSTVVKKVLQGEEAKLAFGIAERGLSRLKLAIPFGTIYGTGSSESFGVGVNAGGDMLDNSVKLRLHPINTRGTNGTDDEDYIDDDITVWKAGSADAVEFPYSSDQVRVYKVTMTLFPDFDQSAGRYLFVIGDTSLESDSTPPSVLAVYPADGASDVDAGQTLTVLLSEELRELAEGVPNASLSLVSDADHSAIDCEVSGESTVDGTAQGATTTTLTLETGDVFADDCMNGLLVEIVSGTGKSSAKVEILDSTASTNRITVAAWPNGTPDTTSAYRIHATRVTVDPGADLSASTRYLIVVSNAVDLCGNVQQDAFVSSFTTAS